MVDLASVKISCAMSACNMKGSRSVEFDVQSMASTILLVMAFRLAWAGLHTIKYVVSWYAAS